ncbi:CpsD/CapB family tyrosine-protein kinase [Qipengyuania aquimaris]|uniref:CpsD/CapB family tyrosine-protein kinase n=1 Tax=Qipengyuania aquimaris TaxID=255984 RepID=A0A9Q3S125_9SPHN|nr:CpsD/CapB family tyrosine-protein kinase [Qipengyuania aquimaris]MBY6218116.1 CpsD/CapB family tyrosine-protein kinase [Qipengyuania aquimaris]
MLDILEQIPATGISDKIVGFQETDIKSRPFKLLRSALRKRMKENGSQAIGVTSPTPGNGKSFISSNLAASLSRVAREATILADFDLQRSTVGSLFDLEPALGIGDFLKGEEVSLSQIARRVEGSNMVLIPAFPQHVATAELMANERMADLISQMRTFVGRPTIICDLPPLFVNDDAVLCAEQLDGVILVVEQGVTTRKQLKTSLEALYPTKILGTVINRFSGSILEPDSYAGYMDYY